VGSRDLVEATVKRPRVPTIAAALLAVAFLVVMALSGHVRETRWLVRFKPGGVMPETTDRIDRVELRTDGRRWVFSRTSGGWRAEPDGQPVPPSLASHLDDSIKFMHVAAPIRVMERAEWAAQGLREFGLDPPGYTATLYHGGRVALGAEFGSPNPQKVLQYMKLAGRDEVYLMPRFIGEEWEQVLKGTTGS
jgi:hypothetical protein